MRRLVRALLPGIVLAAMSMLSIPSTAVLAQSARLDSLERVQRKHPADTNTVNTCIALCDGYRAKDPHRSRRYGEQAVAVAKQLHALRPLARAHCALAVTLAELKQPDEAERQLLLGMAAAEQINLGSALVFALWRLGRLAQETRQYEKAIAYLRRMSEAAEASGDVYWKGQAGNREGIIHDIMGNRDAAMACWSTALRDFEEVKQPEEAARIYSNIGITLAKQGRYDTACALFGKSIAMYDEAGRSWDVANGFYNLAELLLLWNQLDSAKAAYGRSAAIFLQLKDTTSHIETLNRLVIVMRNSGQAEQALEVSSKSLAMSEKIHNTGLSGWTLWEIGNSQLKLGQLDAARESYMRMLRLMDSIGDDEGSAAASSSLGVLAQREGRYGDALRAWDRSVILYSQLRKPEESAKVQERIALVYRQQARLDSAKAVFGRCLQLFESMKDKAGMARTKGYIGGVLREEGRFEKAMELFTECLHLYGELNNTDGTIQILNQMGALHREIGQPKQARAFYQQALALRSPSSDPAAIGNLLRNMGILERSEGRLDTALAYFKRALRIAESSGDRSLANNLLASQASILADQGRNAAALTMYRRNLAGCTALGEKGCVAQAFQNIGALLSESGALDAAYDTVALGTSLAEEIGDMSLAMRGYALLSELAGRRQDFSQAFLHLRSHIALKDSMVSEENLRSINQLRARYESEQQEKTILLLQKDSELHAALVQRQRMELLQRRLEAERNRQRSEVLTLERERNLLELESRGAQLELKDRDLALQKAERQKATREKENQASRASRERSYRNALLGSLVLLIVVSVLGVKRIQAKRMEATLRAEAAEYRAKASEAEADRKEKEYQKWLTRNLLESQEQERKRIAGELHDGLAQDLLVIKNRALRALQASSLPDAAAADFHQIVNMSTAALDDVRQVSQDLRPYQLDRIGLTRTLRGTVQQLEHQVDIRFTAAIDDIDGLFTKSEETALFRIVQECLNNIIKHSGAVEASVTITRGPSQIVLTITDSGKGFRPAGRTMQSGAGLGLQNMSERIEILGGTLSIDSEPGRGTTVVAAIPLQVGTGVVGLAKEA